MPGEAAAVELVAASKEYLEKAALEPTNLVVQRGQVQALVELNGAGKTTPPSSLCSASECSPRRWCW